MQTQYYIKNNIVFSNEKKIFDIVIGDDEFEIDSSYSFPKCNELIILKIEEFIKKNSKKIEILGVVKDFEKVKKNIELNKNNLKKVKLDNYDFIECTSQPLIIEKLILELENQYFKKLDSCVSRYLKENEENEKRKINSLIKNLEQVQIKIEKLKKEIESYKQDEINNLEDKIIKKKNEIEKLEKKLVKIEEKLSLDNKGDNSNKIENIERKINILEKKFEDLDFEIKIQELRKKDLLAEQKKGKKKKVNVILFILTLGLVYWTQYSDIKNAIIRCEQKRYKIEERKIQLKKEIKKLKDKNEELNSKRNESKIKITKTNDNNLNESEKITIETNLLKKELLKFEKEKERKNERYKDLSIKLKNLEEEKKEIEKLKDRYNELSTESIKVKIFELRKNNKECHENLKNALDTIKTQKIALKGEWTYSP